MRNIGGLTLPSGSFLVFKDTPSVKFSSQPILLGEIRPGESVLIKEKYLGTIYDIPEVNRIGHYVGNATFSSRVELLGRPFLDSFVSTKINVQYPVRISSVVFPLQMGRGETKPVEVKLKNISNLLVSNLQLKILVDEYILLENQDVSFKVEEIAPKSSFSISFSVKLGEHCKFFQNYNFTVQLFYKNKLIEFCDLSIRVIPLYHPNTEKERSAGKFFFFHFFF